MGGGAGSVGRLDGWRWTTFVRFTLAVVTTWAIYVHCAGTVTLHGIGGSGPADDGRVGPLYLAGF